MTDALFLETLLALRRVLARELGRPEYALAMSDAWRFFGRPGADPLTRRRAQLERERIRAARGPSRKVAGGRAA